MPTVTPAPLPPVPRILQVLYSYQIGGSEIFGLDLSRQYVERGAQVLCAAIDDSPGPLLERCREYGIQPVDLGIPKRSILGRNGISLHLLRRMRELNPDGIHLQHFLSLNKLGIPARLAGLARVIVTEHSVFDVDQSAAGRVRARLGWRLAAKIVAIHPSIERYLCNQVGIHRERVEVLPIGIDAQRYHRRDRSACRAALGLGEETAFVFVGRLAPVKNVPGLISVFLDIEAPSHRPATLLIVGDGDDREHCEQLVRQHPNGGRVRLLGAQNDPRPYLAAADVFVMNSRSEGTPRAMLEAMATGLPGLCPAVGGVPDLLAGRGWLTAPNDPGSLREGMLSVLENPQQIVELGARCQDYVRTHFESTRITTRYLELLLGRPLPSSIR